MTVFSASGSLSDAANERPSAGLTPRVGRNSNVALMTWTSSGSPLVMLAVPGAHNATDSNDSLWSR
jgi:hypothetical protein